VTIATDSSAQTIHSTTQDAATMTVRTDSDRNPRKKRRLSLQLHRAASVVDIPPFASPVIAPPPTSAPAAPKQLKQQSAPTSTVPQVADLPSEKVMQDVFDLEGMFDINYERERLVNRYWPQ